MIFYLGTHQPYWLRTLDVPLFISRRTLCKIRTPPRAKGPWALDSGGFSELSLYGKWTISPQIYAEEVARWHAEIGNLQWAAIMDWMCEPCILEKTGLSLPEHQRRTVASYLELKELDPRLPWVPVLQGWGPRDYLLHQEMYARAGVDLKSLPLVGLGSVCRRQATDTVERLIRQLYGEGLKLHGFGFKLSGVRRVARYLASSDSLAWSYQARRSPPLPGCTHKNCANCRTYALWWREKVLRAVERSQESEQGVLFQE